MASIPYMPFYIADYLADAAYLSTLEHGAYLLLIMNYWQTGKPLPNDDRKLAAICRLKINKFNKIKSNILEFFSVNEKELTHKRIDEELAKASSKDDGRPPRDDYTCAYCGERGKKLECDHVIPVSRGGSNEKYNLVTSCFSCNRSKSDKLLSEWLHEVV